MSTRQVGSAAPATARCPRCWKHDTVPARRGGVSDWFMRRFGRDPWQCRFCGARFYLASDAPQAG